MLGLILASLLYLDAVPSYALASFYGVGDGFHGKMTSCGEIYDREELSFAHKELPPGTLVRFTFKNRSRVAICNDRGPYVCGREFDLSARLFRELTNNPSQGLAVVRYEIIGYKPRPSMVWNRFGRGYYEHLYRTEVARFVSGDAEATQKEGERAIHK